ncbi:MAG: SIS domain-containing protein [Candidatus Promineofilum sp.]|nr:SIS domain-containing protein [Promineifilum sp.]
MIIGSTADQLGVRTYLRDMQTILDRIDPAPVAAAIAALHAARLGGRQVFVMGNGGSASTASHMVCDLARGRLALFSWLATGPPLRLARLRTPSSGGRGGARVGAINGLRCGRRPPSAPRSAAGGGGGVRRLGGHGNRRAGLPAGALGLAPRGRGHRPNQPGRGGGGGRAPGGAGGAAGRAGGGARGAPAPGRGGRRRVGLLPGAGAIPEPGGGGSTLGLAPRTRRAAGGGRPHWSRWRWGSATHIFGAHRRRPRCAAGGVTWARAAWEADGSTGGAGGRRPSPRIGRRPGTSRLALEPRATPPPPVRRAVMSPK